MQERQIKLPDMAINREVLSDLMLDQSRPIGEQLAKYNQGLCVLRTFLNYFRSEFDQQLTLYQTPSSALVIPVKYFLDNNLIPGHAKLRITDNDEFWVMYGTEIRAGKIVDIIKTSYVARYPKYSDMREDIEKQLAEGQAGRFETILPKLSADPENNHAKIRERFELRDDGLFEVKKDFVDFHFHVAPDIRAAAAIYPDDATASGLELSVPDVLSPSAFNRVLYATFLPHVENITRAR